MFLILITNKVSSINTNIVAVLTGKNNTKKGIATIAKPKLLALCTILLIKIIKIYKQISYYYLLLPFIIFYKLYHLYLIFVRSKLELVIKGSNFE